MASAGTSTMPRSPTGAHDETMFDRLCCFNAQRPFHGIVHLQQSLSFPPCSALHCTRLASWLRDSGLPILKGLTLDTSTCLCSNIADTYPPIFQHLGALRTCCQAACIMYPHHTGSLSVC